MSSLVTTGLTNVARSPRVNGLVEFDGTGQLKVWHQTFHIANHKVHQGPFGHAEHVTHGTPHHGLDLSFCEALLQRGCKVFDDHDGL